MEKPDKAAAPCRLRVERQQKLADELRLNLKKRKALARSRGAQQQAGDANPAAPPRDAN